VIKTSIPPTFYHNCINYFSKLFYSHTKHQTCCSDDNFRTLVFQSSL